ncbi:DUF3107 domain-containing protein [Tessaracoccus palaemonis]|uniref:DUF3107 domain-containing protein n=1 Tax=Tessaracoccus palaemonis TaxID=2829499 RepID=A0ABX8SHV3_9ACTN|nr:DUF3107 domain-containing protein [Tessaracoccus palaemonis]QXT61713.1 DUF3107 domain-containing protein [Tessaracoccus palaemonis]
MEIKIGITHLSREVALESTATPEEVSELVRKAVEDKTLLDLVDEKGRRILIPGDRIGYVDLGSPTARAVGFGAV